MVISHRHRYVFIQTMKTATTAIAAELCENYDGEMRLHKHASLSQFLAQASDDEKTYFSFAGVRNPLDVAVSRFELRRTARRNMDESHREQARFIRENGGDYGAYFRKFGALRADGGADIGTVPLNWNSDEFLAIDYIYRYENLQQEFSSILAKIGVQQLRALPLKNTTTGKADFMSYYDDETLALAYRRYFAYLDHWGYEVPSDVRSRLERERRQKRLRGLFGSVLGRLRHSGVSHRSGS